MLRTIACLVASVALAGAAHAASIEHAPFGTTFDGKPVDVYTMTNDHGLQVQFLSYGGIIKSIRVPDRAGRFDDIVLGLTTLEQYETIGSVTHFGGVIGRYANRIGDAEFTLNGTTYHLDANNGPNTLHGGSSDFNNRLWTVTVVPNADGVSAALSYISPDGEEHFPGTLKTTVTYTLNNDNELRIDYAATTDKPTVINFTNHSYFNLGGDDSGSVAGQLLQINADAYTPTDSESIPTGQIAPVVHTPLDFRQMTPIGARLRSSFEQMIYARGYDHNWVINRPAGTADMVFAARAYDPIDGRVLDCFTTEPGLQVYTSNSLDGSVVGSSGAAYRQTDAFTLETEHFPDSPNKPNFPTTLLNPGETYHSSTIYRFATDANLPPTSL